MWWIIVAAVIVSFLAWFGPNQPNYRTMFAGGSEHGTVYGRAVRADEVRAAYKQIEMMAGRRSLAEDVALRESYRRILLAEKYRQLGIVVTDEVLAENLRTSMRDPSTGQSLLDRQLEAVHAQGYADSDFFELMRFNVAQRHLQDVVSIPSQLVTPREAEAQVRQDNEQALVTAVFFSASNHLATVQVTPDGLGRYFTNHIANYRTSEKTIASYVRFHLSNHLAQAAALIGKAPDTAAKLESVYAKRGADAFRDLQGNPLSKDAAIARLRDEYAREQALEMAANDANDFYNDLAKIEPAKAENLDAVAAKKGLKVEITQPFAGNERVLGLEAIPRLSDQLARLGDAPFSEPITTAAGVYIVAVRQRIPPVTPTLDSIRARVTDEYRRSLAIEAARTAGQAFANLATNALASGKTFAALVAEQRLAAVEIPAFTLQMNMLPGLPAQADLLTLKDTAFALQPGQVSGLLQGRDGGYVIQLRERKAPSDEFVKAEVPKVASELRQREERAGFSEWLASEWKASGLAERFDDKSKKNAAAQPR